jgi:alpha-mannosidase
VTLSVYAAPDRIPYAEAVRGEYRPAQVGEVFGPAWSTHWFRADIAIPSSWEGREVHLLWDSSSEACIWQDGEPRQGLAGSGPSPWEQGARRAAYPLTRSAKGGERIGLYIEMACNGLFGADPKHIFPLKQAEIALFDREAWDLLWDFTIVADMAWHLPPSSPRAGQALFAGNEMVNICRLDDRRTWSRARAVAAEFLSARNGTSQHNLSAIGHAHIDTAWLWPLAETKRKCIRTFSTALRLMEEYPDYKFACSQAQQYAWIKEMQPKMYAEIKRRVKEGRFVPAGGTWVEPDCNIPSGESLVRQFLYGQRFFREEFGLRCGEFWNPDVFGYSAALPQIMLGAGIRCFLTQKLSWNQFNKPANSTLLWEGIDGSQVLTHFPPADTYNATATVEEVLRDVTNFKNHERSSESYMLFGYGDGGGGPTREMLEQLSRMGDVDGLPRVKIRPPEEFFERCAADIKDPAVWVGELYFELHRGTYTTQAHNKRDNRRSEFLLHDLEFLSALAHAQGRAPYPAAELDRLWKLVLLNQFHDIIPGSSISEVYRDSAAHYAEVLSTGERLRQRAVSELVGSLPSSGKRAEGGNCILAINALSAPRTEVAELPVDVPTPQRAANGKSLAIASAPAMGYATFDPNAHPKVSARVAGSPDLFTLENEWVRATFGRGGHLVSLFDRRLGREAIPPGEAANRLVIFEDKPLNWDAWDVDVFHLEKRDEVGSALSARILEAGPLRAAVEFSYALSDLSSLKQIVSLTCASPRLDFSTEADWHERDRFLKVEFPLDIRADNATYEIQFGHVWRPTHFNTTWDLARFEVCAHRWADLSEAGFGVALINDSKYGYAALRNVMRLSLLRSPKSPDPEADMGHHSFRYALLPHAGDFRQAGVIEEGYRFNVPLLLRASEGPVKEASFFSVSRPSAVIDAVKKAEDSDAIIVRLYEAHGGRGPVRLSSPLPVKKIARCNLLEEDDEPLKWAGGGADFDIKPFQIVTLKLDLR